MRVSKHDDGIVRFADVKKHKRLLHGCVRFEFNVIRLSSHSDREHGWTLVHGRFRFAFGCVEVLAPGRSYPEHQGQQAKVGNLPWRVAARLRARR